jgi:hypothetical protein
MMPRMRVTVVLIMVVVVVLLGLVLSGRKERPAG